MRRQSRQEEFHPKVELKPSTELIPDEYEFIFTGEELVYAFVAEEKWMKTVEEKFASSNLNSVKIEYLDDIDEVMNSLDKIAKADDDPSGLFLLFWGFHNKEDDELFFPYEDGKNNCLRFSDILSKFMYSNCEKLKNKPKIFIFNTVKNKNPYEADGEPEFMPRKDINVFDNPYQSDMLIIFKSNKYLDDSEEFIDQLFSNINRCGNYENLSSIVTMTTIDDDDETRPVIISTMLKKFYMTQGSIRGPHHIIIEQNHGAISDTVFQMECMLSEVTEKRKIKKPSFMKRVRSFIKNNKNGKENGTHKTDEEIINESSSSESRRPNSMPVVDTIMENPVKVEDKPSTSGTTKPTHTVSPSIKITPLDSKNRLKTSLTRPVISSPRRSLSINPNFSTLTKSNTSLDSKKGTPTKKPFWKP